VGGRPKRPSARRLASPVQIDTSLKVFFKLPWKLYNYVQLEGHGVSHQCFWTPWYFEAVKVEQVVVVVAVLASACASSQSGEIMKPNIDNAPDSFVLRDVRKDAAHHLGGCRVPSISALVGPWSGSEGNVTAYGCGFRITYYLRCITRHQCKMTIFE
jgi:hypothetical protein